MLNTSSLKLNSDFRRVYSRGKSFAAAYIVIYARQTKRAEKRLGLTVGKAFGKAVRRNRAKRLMREAYRCVESALPDGFDFIIVARTRAQGADLAHIKRDMNYAFRKLGLL